MKFKLDENLPASSAAILASAGHDADTVAAEGLTGAPDPDVVAATAAGRILISLDVGLGDIRAYPPGSHTGTDDITARIASGELAPGARLLGHGRGHWFNPCTAHQPAHCLAGCHQDHLGAQRPRGPARLRSNDKIG